MAVYYRFAPHAGMTPDDLALLVRVLWSVALVLSPIILLPLIAVELYDHTQSQPETNTPTPPTDGIKTKNKKRFTDMFHDLTNSGKGEVTQTGKPQAPSLAPVMAESGKKAPKRTSKKAAPRTADSADTGTDKDTGNRYAKVRSQVLAGKVRPSKPAIKKAAQCGQPTAEKYLAAMEGEGIIQRMSNGRYQTVDNVIPLKAGSNA